MVAIKATFITLVIVTALTSTFFLNKKVAQTKTASVQSSLAARFVNEATTFTQKNRSMDSSEHLRRAQENKRIFRNRITDFDKQSTVTKSAEANAEDCTSSFCQKQLSDACFVEWKVNNVVPSTLSMTLVCKGNAWVAIGFSENGKMMASDAVLGIPGSGSNPEKYRLGGYDQSAIVPMEAEKQTLIDANVSYDNAADVTILKFTKIMSEDGQIEIKPGKNTFLYAKGISEVLNYHQERDLFELTLAEVAVAVDMAPPADDGEEESSQEKNEDENKEEDDSDQITPPADDDQEQKDKEKDDSSLAAPPADDGEEESSGKEKKDKDKDKDDSSLATSPADDGGEVESSEKKKKEKVKEEDDSTAPPADDGGEEESSEKKKKDKDEVKDDLAAVDTSEKQSKESNKKQGLGDGKGTIAELFASLGPIQLRPLNPKDLRPQLSPPQPNVESNFPYPYPKIRYVAWESLSSQTKEILKENFGYSKYDWDALGQNENERKTCSQLSDKQREALKLLAWNCDMWDCFINHYKSFNAKQLEAAGLVEHVNVVRSSWVKPYKDLTDEELQSANRLCFTEVMWDFGYIIAT
jgi:hypothetical protein